MEHKYIFNLKKINIMHEFNINHKKYIIYKSIEILSVNYTNYIILTILFKIFSFNIFINNINFLASIIISFLKIFDH